MLASDGPSFNLWADPAGHVGSGSGDAIDDSDNFSISTDMFYDILNEGQGQDAPPGMEDKIPNRYSNQFDIPVFSEIPSNFQDGIYQQQPWPFTSEIGQPGFGIWSPSNNLEFSIHGNDNGMGHSFMPSDDIGRCENVYIESVNEDTPQDQTQATCEKPSNFFEPFDYYVSPDHLFTDQICEGGVMGIPQQKDSKPVITDDVYQKSDWLSLSYLDQDKYARLKMKSCDFHGTSDTVDNHLFGRSLGCAGSSNFDVEDIELVSDSGCLVDLTHSDSDDDVMVKCMKTGYAIAGRSAGNFNSASISASTSEYKKVFPKEALGEFSNTEKVSFKIGQKAIADDQPFVRETSRLSFEKKAPANWSNSSPGSSSHMEDNTDIYIVEEANDLQHSTPITSMQKDIHATSQPPVFGDSLHLVGMGEQRVRTHDERVTYRLALQDLSQQNKEASPPDGVLAVPLLRHQRIALSWMSQKETAGSHCSGGILADDQGLGKTVSTIALILTEKSPSSKSNSDATVDVKLESLDLDEDDGCLQPDEMKLIGSAEAVCPKPEPVKKETSVSVCKGRPAAGTLIVCPTSVLRQWAEELQNKVTDKAKLSVLTYHGSNRTRDPNELAKYDVVLTTYSIVSMEVPKQPPVDQDGEKTNNGGQGFPELPTSKKRKQLSSDKKHKMHKMVTDEPFSRPLAKVGWFRVVLDEAQSIKNHRTQVARACWGLRAKRRWCLSGTPIQNAIDDLYSYFRFLRYDPYAAYKSFCSMIKIPITKNPANGYKKLQAVLQTIMLRRTKGTLIDGEPIIKLPPKFVSLKKVEFSTKERNFYCRLEADSREKFKVYADAGTVKQNYVNILLMLLRLRQACDHPNLVKGFDSGSVQRLALESGKNLSQEKRKELLNCLEACQSLCGICNDPPEDASITICGHVFCNQCICERLSSEENICPVSHCKTQIGISLVFSRIALTDSISGEINQGNLSDGSCLGLVEKTEYEMCFSTPSSKIKAALDILQSLQVVQQPNAKNGSIGQTPGVICLGQTTLFPVSEGSRSVQASDALVAKAPEKAIVFSQWTRMLDLLEEPLKESHIQYRRLDGTMSVLARDKAVKDFKTLPEVTVMIMSLKAASLGLNMVAACHVLLLDLWWNPTTEDQAIDRAHRIGQTRPVSVTRLTIKDTVEDRILALQEKKRRMVSSAFGEDERGGRQTRLTEDDLKYLFMV